MGRKSREKRQRRNTPASALAYAGAVTRIGAMLSLLNREAPAAGEIVQEYVDTLQDHNLARWPSWCWAPAGVVDAVFRMSKGTRPRRYRENPNGYIGEVLALLAWERTKTILCFDDALVDAITEGEPLDRLPPQAFLQLPVWCPYISYPARDEVPGFFACLSYKPSLEQPVLYLWLDGMDPQDFGGLHLLEISLFLDRPTIREGIVDSIASAVLTNTTGKQKSLRLGPDGLESAEWAKAVRRAGDPGVTGLAALQVDVASWCCQLLLYVCSAGADIRDPSGEPGEIRASGSHEPRLWEVGWRVGADLRRFKDDEEAGRDAGRASVRPHVRRAHWHHYWTGPRNGAPEDRALVLRWIPPTLVAAEVDSIIPTVRNIPTGGGVS